MSRTRRTVPKTPRGWMGGFAQWIERGLVPVPKAEVLKSGKKGIDEVWTAKSKKRAKQLYNRWVRRHKMEVPDA